jgi:hypothetical protein
MRQEHWYTRKLDLISSGYLTHGHIPLVLRLLILMLFLVLLVAILVKGQTGLRVGGHLF